MGHKYYLELELEDVLDKVSQTGLITYSVNPALNTVNHAPDFSVLPIRPQKG